MDIASKLTIAKNICQKRKLLLTKDRINIYELICQNKKPIKAYSLLEKLQKSKHNAKPPTIYRALDFLEQNGFIHKTNISNSYYACNHAEEQHSCQLFICSKCYEVKEFCQNDLIAKLDQKAKSQKFLTQNISIEILGICIKCQS